MKRDKPFKCRHKGYKEQYRLNLEVSDHLAMATTQLNKIQPSSDKDKAALEKAKKELEKGASALVEHQKHIFT